MTFPARLTELLEKATKGTGYSGSAMSELRTYLFNHAEALRDLVVAAEPALRYIQHVGANQVMRGLPHPQEKIVNDLSEALAKLEEA